MVDRGTGGGPPKFEEANREFEKGPASQTVLSLSQALLAPLDAILKAQVHVARSFLNLLLQIGYPHRPATPAASGGSGEGTAAAAEDGLPYQMDFYHEVPNAGRQKLSIPTLALVPLNPLGVTEAEFEFDFFVRRIARHDQIMAAEGNATTAEAAQTKDAPTGPLDRRTRPWYLVDTPLSLQGTFAPSAPDGTGADISRVDDARFHVQVKVGVLPLPAALEKLMVSLGQISAVQDLPPQG